MDVQVFLWVASHQLFVATRTQSQACDKLVCIITLKLILRLFFASIPAISQGVNCWDPRSQLSRDTDNLIRYASVVCYTNVAHALVWPVAMQVPSPNSSHRQGLGGRRVTRPESTSKLACWGLSCSSHSANVRVDADRAASLCGSQPHQACRRQPGVGSPHCTQRKRQCAAVRALSGPDDPAGYDAGRIASSLDSMDLNQLQTALTLAIKAEDYSLAARIRDAASKLNGTGASQIDWGFFGIPEWLRERARRLGYPFPTGEASRFVCCCCLSFVPRIGLE